MAALRDALQEQTQRLESALARTGETSQQLEQHSAQLENVQQQALAGFKGDWKCIEPAPRRNAAPVRRILRRSTREFERHLKKRAPGSSAI